MFSFFLKGTRRSVPCGGAASLCATGFHSVDVMKVLMSWCVIVIHVNAMRDEGALPLVANSIVRLAVPFFFVTSGFLLWGKIDPRRGVSPKSADDALAAYVRKSLIMYILWTAVYVPTELWTFLTNDRPWWKDACSFFWHVCVQGAGSWSWQLWYLWMLMLSVAAMRFALRRGTRLKGIVVTGLGLLLVFALLTKVNGMGWLDGFALLHRGLELACSLGYRFSQALAFVSLGMAVRRLGLAERLQTGWAWLLLVVGCCFYGLVREVACYPAVLGLMVLVMRWHLPERGELYVNLRRLSVLIYFTHQYFVYWAESLRLTYFPTASVVETSAAVIAIVTAFCALLLVWLRPRCARAFKMLGVS